MTPEKLVGNLDMKMLNNKGLFRYNVNESFLVKKYAIFEEMADAAVPVLFLLKDTLQRGKFRDGTQQVDIATKTIVVNSNRSPSSVAEYGADAAALVQRWPIEVNVIWPSHKANDYVMLINKQQPHIQGPNLDSSSRDHLAQMLADTSAKGEPIPPRIALDAVRAIKTMAIIRGRDGIHGSDFNALRYVRGLQAVGAVAEKTMKDSEMRSLAVKAFETKKQECFDLQKEYADCKTPIPCIQISKRAEKLIGEVNGLIITDNLENGKKNLIADLIELKNQAVTSAVGFVKI
jgi:hypothetical protein